MGACFGCDAQERPDGRHAAPAWQREEDFLALYDVVEVLGEGSMGMVSIVRRRKGFHRSLSEAEGDGEDHRLFAMKTIHVGRVPKSDRLALRNEIEVLKELDHPNIVHLYEVLYSKRRVYVVMELCRGGHLSKSGCEKFTEARACFVFKQILQGLAYLHEESISHNDLKAENVVFVDRGIYSEIRLIDFGLSQRYLGEYLKRVCGTYYTMAPEVYFPTEAGGYGLQADMWSAGVILYIMLGKGQFPFLESSEQLVDELLVERWRTAKYLFDPVVWQGISRTAKELVARLLKRLPTTRATAKEALAYVQDVWEPMFPKDEDGYFLRETMVLHKPEYEEESIMMSPQSSFEDVVVGEANGHEEHLRSTGVQQPMLNSMKDYASYSELKKNILMIVAYNVDRGKLKRMARDFVDFDTGGEGSITFIEFQKALESHHMDNEELRRLFEAVDLDHTGRIRYREFLAASVEALEFQEDVALQDAFDRLDSDNSGYISHENLTEILGEEYADEEIRAMVEEAGGTTEKGIDYEHFLKFMRQKRREETHAELPIVRTIHEESQQSEGETKGSAQRV